MKYTSINLFINAVLILFSFSLSHAEKWKIEFAPSCFDDKSTPVSAKSNCKMGVHWLEKGDHEKALGLFKEAVKEYPTYEYAKQKIKELERLIPKLRKKAKQQSAPVIIIGVERERKRREKARRKAARKAADEKRRAEEAQISAKRAAVYSKCTSNFQATCEKDCSSNKYQYNVSCYQACIRTHCGW